MLGILYGGIVTGPTRREACRSICKALLDRGMVQTVANRYIEDKTEEYSSQQAWSSIGEQYPEGLTGGVIRYVSNNSVEVRTESQTAGKSLIQDTSQKIRNQTTRQNKKTRLKLKLETETRKGSVKQLTLGE